MKRQGPTIDFILSTQEKWYIQNLLAEMTEQLFWDIFHFRKIDKT